MSIFVYRPKTWLYHLSSQYGNSCIDKQNIFPGLTYVNELIRKRRCYTILTLARTIISIPTVPKWDSLLAAHFFNKNQ